jgi:hypothetical protein
MNLTIAKLRHQRFGQSSAAWRPQAVDRPALAGSAHPA